MIGFFILFSPVQMIPIQNLFLLRESWVDFFKVFFFFLKLLPWSNGLDLNLFQYIYSCLRREIEFDHKVSQIQDQNCE